MEALQVERTHFVYGSKTKHRARSLGTLRADLGLDGCGPWPGRGDARHDPRPTRGPQRRFGSPEIQLGRVVPGEVSDGLTVQHRQLLPDGVEVIWFEEGLQNKLERRLQRYARQYHLTAAERAALVDIARGLSAKESALRLSLSPETVRARRKRIFRKVGADGCGSDHGPAVGRSARVGEPRRSLGRAAAEAWVYSRRP